MPVIKIVDNNIEVALQKCKKLFSEIKRTKSKYAFHLRKSLKIREKKKLAVMKRKFY